MAEPINDDEQLEAFKRWWKENGLVLVLAVVLGGGGWFGWQYWQDSRQQLAEDASLLYMEMMDAAEAIDSDGLDDQMRNEIIHYAGALKDLHEDSQYARYGALMLARLAVMDNDLDAAAAELQWVQETAADPQLERIARLRLARVESARGNDNRALELLSVDDAGELRAAYAETRGDIQARLGNREEARSAYRQAMEQLAPDDTGARSVLELKLSQVSPAKDADAGETEEDA